MTVEDMKVLEADLEREELEAAIGTPLQAQKYTQLLAIYLYHNDLCNAKMLWKRIPEAVKLADEELNAVWRIGQRMWQRDFYLMHLALAQTDSWTEPVAPIMDALKGQVRSRALELIGSAYSSITIESLARLLGETPAQAVASAASQPGWQIVEGNMVLPKKPAPAPGPPLTSEDQLDKLTEFVSFLEN
ncbi:COP9 signalosome complex subunit 8 [Neocloeon triangulifer]|uniref:COP9 signalosome complex subunit 8 n=1 Tax=Neocloeon triangulifer TaxID=2078957 RepID=UPI00286FA066|nr:COP9 signalosome complex subunit 8 [Neocloeon triangulifer]